MSASALGHLASVQLLLEKGAQVNACDVFGRNALHRAIENLTRNRDKVAHALLDAGADPNAKCSEGETPLMRAAQRGMLDHIKLALRAGADPRLQNNKGVDAAGYARANGCADVALLLRQKEAEMEADQIKAALPSGDVQGMPRRHGL